MPAGRPSDYTPETAATLCEYLATGMSLRTAVQQDGMPTAKTVYKWMADHPEFLSQYEKAKSDAADAMVEDMLDIADNGTGDTQRDRLRVDTRKWIASKLKAKKYGEKITHEGGDKPIGHEVQHVLKVNGVASNRDKPND